MYFVYMLVSRKLDKIISYVGYTNNLKKRIIRHNSNKGAKATKGYKWELIFKKGFKTKSEAMSYEYKLKKDRKKRSSILKSN